jgi:hypothetical protein
MGKVDFLSSVSGGSLSAAYYALSRDPGEARPGDLVWTPESYRPALEADFIASYAGRSRSPVDFLRYYFTGYNKSSRMADSFADLAFGDRRLGDLNPNRPKLIINATAMFDGRPFPVTDGSLARLGIKAAGLRVADAVQASTAVPGLFQPLALPRFIPAPPGDGAREDRRPGQAGPTVPTGANGPPDPKRTEPAIVPPPDAEPVGFVHLVDGAIYDNFGVASLLDIYLRNKARFPRGAVLIIVDSTRPDLGAPESTEKANLRSATDYLFDAPSANAAAAILLDIIRRDTFWHLREAARTQPIKVFHLYYPAGVLPEFARESAGPPDILGLVVGSPDPRRTPSEVKRWAELFAPTNLNIDREAADKVRAAADRVWEAQAPAIREALK